MRISGNEIYYLTGTGNSLKIAKDLADELGKTTLNSMPRAVGKIEGRIVGFVFPIYFARPPVFVQEFVERSMFGDIEYLFLIANGGGLFGTGLKILEAQLNDKGQTVHSGFLVDMPGNHPKISSMQKKPHGAYFAREKERIKEIARIVSNKDAHGVETNLGPLGKFFSHVAFRGPWELSKAHRLDESLRVNERCVGCGTCERVCAVGNILRKSPHGKPEWQHKCINCAACYHHCPQEAIEFSGVRRQMKRYRHPEISLEEIA